MVYCTWLCNPLSFIVLMNTHVPMNCAGCCQFIGFLEGTFCVKSCTEWWDLDCFIGAVSKPLNFNSSAGKGHVPGQLALHLNCWLTCMDSCLIAPSCTCVLLPCVGESCGLTWVVELAYFACQVFWERCHSDSLTERRYSTGRCDTLRVLVWFNSQAAGFDATTTGAAYVSRCAVRKHSRDWDVCFE